MIEARRLQRSFGDGLIAEEIEDLQETWMRHVDVVLQDDVIVSTVYHALAHRNPNSRRHGRPGFPADVVLRLLILKHVRNWSYAVADAGFYSVKNEIAAQARGVKRVCIPNLSTKSADRRREQKKRWFRSGQRWRTGCEGRISVSKRRHGLNRCRYPGDDGMMRWVGLGIIADNLINLGLAIPANSQPNSYCPHPDIS